MHTPAVAEGTLTLRVLGLDARFRFGDGEAAGLLRRNFSALSVPHGREVDLPYEIASDRNGFVITPPGEGPLFARSDAELLYLVEKDLTIALQHRRPDLLFIHGAALARNGRACLLIAPSGGGKSTTAWGLLQQGFSYLSDELAPIEPATGQVHAYPHALCLKTVPPLSHPLPPQTLRTCRTLHVPVESFPLPADLGPRPLETIFFVRYRPEAGRPSLRTVSSATAATLLYANTLNALAHPCMGLDAVMAIAGRCRSYAVTTCSNLAASAELIRHIFEGGTDDTLPEASGGC